MSYDRSHMHMYVTERDRDRETQPQPTESPDSSCVSSLTLGLISTDRALRNASESYPGSPALSGQLTIFLGNWETGMHSRGVEGQ